MPAAHSFPTRRSSDLSPAFLTRGTLQQDARFGAVTSRSRSIPASFSAGRLLHQSPLTDASWFRSAATSTVEDRKSTRLNSSHGYISYAVFCLKKKNK